MTSNTPVDLFGRELKTGDYVIFDYYDSLTIGRLFKLTDQKAYVVALPNISRNETWQPFVTNTYKRNIVKCDVEITGLFDTTFRDITIKIIPGLAACN